MICWPSGFVKAWGTKAQKPQFVQKHLVCGLAAEGGKADKNCCFWKMCACLASAPQASTKPLGPKQLREPFEYTPPRIRAGSGPQAPTFEGRLPAGPSPGTPSAEAKGPRKLLRVRPDIFDFQPDLGLQLGQTKPKISGTVPTNRHTTIPDDYGPISACFDDDPKL